MQSSHPRTARPLSSQRKKEDTEWKQEDDLAEIQRAIQAENKALKSKKESESKQKPSQPRTSTKEDVSTNTCQIVASFFALSLYCIKGTSDTNE